MGIVDFGLIHIGLPRCLLVIENFAFLALRVGFYIYEAKVRFHS